MSKRWMLALVTALLIYLGLGLVFGIQDLSHTLQELPLGWWLLAPATALGSHAVLFQRWQFYLRYLGCPLAWRPSARVYLAGLALIAVPGRSGEALRGLWLKQRHGFPLQVGVGITLAERLADLAGALVVLSWGLGERVWAAVLVGFAMLSAGGWVLTHPSLIRRMEQALEHLPLHPHWHGPIRLLRETLLVMGRVRQLTKPKPLLLGTLLASICWLAEAAVLMGIYESLGTALSLPQAAVVRTATGLGGVVSLLPAGLGTSEATAIGLAMAYGAGRSDALAATLILRFSTLAVPCGLGVATLMRQKDLRHS